MYNTAQLMTRKFGLAMVAACLFTGRSPAAEQGYYSQPELHGDRLVFVSEGDLWTLSLDAHARSGQPVIAHRLTSSDGSEARPAVSPDGNWIAYTAQYDGNTDCYIIPAIGGAPTRLTFHPGSDEVLGWSPDSSEVVFRSGRAHPHGRNELYRVNITGGLPRRYEFGDCSLASFSVTGKRIAFTPHSNEHWTWKRYRGGTAPDIWVGEIDASIYRNLTNDNSNDLFPMWLLGRVFFVSDRSGTMNIFSDVPHGGDLRQHTRFAADDANPTAVSGYDVRWPAKDSQRRGSAIVFCQAGGLALLDVNTDEVTRLNVLLASDRVATRQRFASVGDRMSEVALSPDGSHLAVGARGEILIAPVEGGSPRQITETSDAREWGINWFGHDQVLLISDAPGEQQVALLSREGAEMPSAVTTTNTQWLFPPIGSRDGQWIIYADKSMRLNRINMGMLEIEQIDRSDAGEIHDYRVSPDSQWVAYTRPMENGFSQVMLHSLRTKRNFTVSNGMTVDSEPRWDPKGRYLFFLSERHHDPMLGTYDFDHVYLNTTRLVVVPLRADTPPPFPEVADAAGFDLEAWSSPDASTDDEVAPGVPEGVEFGAFDDAGGPRFQDAVAQIRIDTDGIVERQCVVAHVEPGTYDNLEATFGGVTMLSATPEGLLSDDWGSSDGLGPGDAKLVMYRFADEQVSELAVDVAHHAMSDDRSTVAWAVRGGFSVMSLDDQQVHTVDLSSEQLRVNITREWSHILAEAWRLQRDFYWAPNMAGTDWDAMRMKYETLLTRVGTREELNDLIGEMIGELGTSHTYIWGGEQHDEAAPVSVGLLGVDVQPVGSGYQITRILPSHPWDASLVSPLAQSHIDVMESSIITAIDRRSLVGVNLHDLLQGKAGRFVTLTVTDANGQNSRDVRIRTIDSDVRLRYSDWVESNRRYVAEQTDGQVGYIHIPNMGGDGLAAFSRQFYPQFKKQAFVIDVRNNGGGFVSQMIIERLARQTLAFDQPRHGKTSRYPARGIMAHMCCLIDQHAGSDGDIFPTAFRMKNLGALIGTRTWGGVVGIRGDKPFVDAGLSTQPEFAWWDARGWSIENTGVEPDIEVPFTPEDHAAGRDPQLDRAIAHLLERLEQEPINVPKVPAYPDR